MRGGVRIQAFGPEALNTTGQLRPQSQLIDNLQRERQNEMHLSHRWTERELGALITVMVAG